MQQLSALDASFVYFESSRTPMHIGGIYIFEPLKDGKTVNYDSFRDYLSARLHLAKPFRQRLVEAPLEIGYPVWVNDPEFNIENHLSFMALPKPGGYTELRNLASRLFSRQLDRSRPLWEAVIVEGLDGCEDLPKGAFAMIVKVHHAAIDGVSGAELLVALFDFIPQGRRMSTPPPFEPERIPTGVELLAKSTGNISPINTPLKLAKFLTKSVGKTVGLAASSKYKKLKAPPFPYTAPKTRFNVKVSPHRVFGGLRISLKRIKDIKNSFEGITVNDVILAVCSGALRRYLNEKDELPKKKSLIALAPISIRSKAQSGQGGNKISAMLVSLATHIDVPLARLQMIHESTVGSKVYSGAMQAEQLMDFIPSSVAALAAKMYTQLEISELQRPFNLVITNVPGPQIPLYMNGAQLISNYGFAPLLDGLGLLIALFSYNGMVSVGITTTREIMPDIDLFKQYILESLDELETAVEGFVAQNASA